MNIRILWLLIALYFAPAMAQMSLTELLSNPAKVRNIVYSTHMQTMPYTNFGQLNNLVEGDAEQHFRETGDKYWAAAYKITLTKGDRIRLKSSKIDGDSHLDVYLKNGDKYEFVDHNVSISATDLDSYLSLIIQKDGDYYIVIADNEPDIQGFHTLTVWIPTDPLYTDVFYTTLMVNELPALGLKFNLTDLRSGDFPAIGYRFVAEKGKTYAIKVRYFAKAKHDMFYSITLLNNLTGNWNKDMVATNNKWDYDVFELAQSIIYTANEDGTVYILLDNYDPHGIERFYEDVYCTIEIKDIKEKESVNLAKLLDTEAQPIMYNQKLAFVTSGEMIGFVKGQSGIFRSTGNNYYVAGYKITLAQNDNIEILSSKEYPSAPYLDSYLYLYRKNGDEYELIAENDDCYKTDNNLDSYLNFTATKAGDYYIVVTDARPNLAGSYYLKVWNTDDMPDAVITGVYANANRLTIEEPEEILENLTKLSLRGIVGNETVAIINNPYGWTIANDKRSATYDPTNTSSPYGFKYANGLKITVNLSMLSSPVVSKTLQLASFRAWAQNGTLHLNGLTAGKAWKVYTASGALVWQGIANGANATMHLNAKGVYFVHSEKQTLKVVNR